MWNWISVNRIRLAGIVLTLALLLSAVGMWLGISARKQSQALREEVQNMERRYLARQEPHADTVEQSYLFLAYEGKIGIFNQTGDVLFAVLEVDLRTLPSADRAMLAEGIVVHSEAEMRALSEDYTS